jgi:hypothetical protein
MTTRWPVRSAALHELAESLRTPFPELRSLRIESAKGEQPQFTVAALGMKLLHARKVRAHDRDGAIDDRFVKGRHVVLLNQLCADVLQKFGVSQFRFQFCLRFGQCGGGAAALFFKLGRR